VMMMIIFLNDAPKNREGLREDFFKEFNSVHICQVQSVLICGSNPIHREGWSCDEDLGLYSGGAHSNLDREHRL
jgi:hypothetical protein